MAARERLEKDMAEAGFAMVAATFRAVWDSHVQGTAVANGVAAAEEERTP